MKSFQLTNHILTKQSDLVIVLNSTFGLSESYQAQKMFYSVSLSVISLCFIPPHIHISIPINFQTESLTNYKDQEKIRIINLP